MSEFYDIHRETRRALKNTVFEETLLACTKIGKVQNEFNSSGPDLFIGRNQAEEGTKLQISCTKGRYRKVEEKGESRVQMVELRA